MNKLIYILIFLLLASVGLNVYQFTRPVQKETQYTEIRVHDTVINVVKNFDTVYISNTIYKDKIKYDTIHFNNTVYLKDTLHNYRFIEREYDLAIRAVKLDNYKLDIHAMDTVRIIEKDTYTVKEVKQKPFSVGAGLGVGYSLTSKKIEPFVGITITYKLF